MVTRTDGEALADERAPEENLDDMLLEARAIDSAPDAGAEAMQQAQAQQAAQVVDSTAAELFGAAQLVRGMLLPLLPDHKAQRVAVVWTDAVLQQSATAGAAIMQMNGWTMGEAFSKYGPYVMLFATLAGPVIQTRKIMAEPDPKPAAEGVQHHGV